MLRTMSKLLMSKLWLLLSLLVLAACNVAVPTTSDELLSSEGVNPQGYVFNPIRVGAGGFITGLDISSDGSLVIARADTYGLYRLNQTNKRWSQLVVSSRLPATDVSLENAAGVYELAIAPSNANRAYMVWNNYVYRSDNKGSSWTRTSAPDTVNRSANDPQDYSKDGPKMAVDPRNPDVVIVGAQDYENPTATAKARAYLTLNGGRNWQPISRLPKGQVERAGDNYQGRGLSAIVFDPSSPALPDGRTSMVYASSYKNGVYRSTDGGTNWTRTGGGPNFLRQVAMASDGTLYGLDGSDVWRYRTNAWTKITPSGSAAVSVAVSPADAARLLVINGGGTMWQSNDRGANWSAPLPYTLTSNDVPWLATSEAKVYLSPGKVKFDPVKVNRVWVTAGTGVYFADITPASPSVALQSLSAGIEQLVGNEVVAPPSSKPVVAAWDFGTFYIDNPDTYRSKQAISDRFNSTWDVDYMITKGNAGFGDGTLFMVGNTSDHRNCCDDGLELQAGYSVDSGKSWTRFASMPTGATNSFEFGFGNIAVNSGDPNNIIWMSSNGGGTYYTTDRGGNWKPIVLPGGTTLTSSHNRYSLNRRVLVSDKSKAGVFYLAHSGQQGVENSGGLYRTDNGGQRWTKAFTSSEPFVNGALTPYSDYNAILKNVPGKAGHLFFTAGPQSDLSEPNLFRRSTTFGTSWNTVPNVRAVRAFGFGKVAAGSIYPTIFISGEVNNQYGLWRSTDNAVRWSKISDYPLGSLDNIQDIDGDKDVFGRLYLAFGGSGFGYGYSANGQ
jgi:photosystem II stability/assembly factor-like uncharacterized protein